MGSRCLRRGNVLHAESAETYAVNTGVLSCGGLGLRGIDGIHVQRLCQCRHGRYSSIIIAIRTQNTEEILVFEDLLARITSMEVLPGRGWGFNTSARRIDSPRRLESPGIYSWKGVPN